MFRAWATCGQISSFCACHDRKSYWRGIEKGREEKIERLQGARGERKEAKRKKSNWVELKIFTLTTLGPMVF